MIKLDKKKFLELPLNDGMAYWNAEGCGRIKGIFSEASNLSEKFDSDLRLALGPPICKVENFDGYATYTRISREKRTPFKKAGYGGQISDVFPKLAQVLDIGEYILLKGYPQKAKLYVLHMIEKFNLCEIIDELPVEQVVREKDHVVV